MILLKCSALAVLLLVTHSCAVNSQSPADYENLKSSITLRRQTIAGQYKTAGAAQQDSLLKVARAYLIDKISNDIFNAWYGTPWEFYGMTQIPREGTIACGYFVTTVLRDAGFSIPRVKWAQSASEPVIKKLSRDIKRFHNSPVEDVEAWINTKEDGLYIVGLDCHVGFIMKKGREVFFVHSNYYQKSVGVMKQTLKSKNPLSDSKYRVIGKILDDELVRNWILNVKME